ncbi:MAG: hypothetical protein QGI05_04600, partial [Candidatus Omnitrophota bacterium]|nr:hypothetical protein [Candidatus Omnitrophota bacterium]
MNRLLIALGVILSAIWASVMAITRGVPVFVCGFLKSITFGVLDGALDNIQNGFYYELPNRDMPTVVFLILFVLAFILYFAISIKITKGESNKRTFFIVIFFSLLFRLILLPSISIHENDIYRYLWDGKVSNAGINPYKYAPDDLDSLTRNLEEHELKRLDGLREKNLLYFSRIGHSGVPTIYPPFAQFIFMLSTRIQEDSI